MSNESISKKLSELFELHKSGAITQEEFENLKKKAISENEVQIVENVKKHDQESVKTPKKPTPVKKIIGVFLIIIGVSFFLWTGYGFIKEITTTSEQRLEQAKKIYEVSGYTENMIKLRIESDIDSIERMRKLGIIFNAIAVSLGVGIAFSGFILVKKRININK